MSIKLESGLAKEIESVLKEFKYSTKTEFIRDAIRTKLKELSDERRKEKAWQALFAARGSLKGMGKSKTDEEWLENRKKYSEEIFNKLEKKYSLK
ncbi:MAG: ribbon-helix-helix domain-containing protein [Candidatus Diapherotrites archaeon]|nr:ribbon-helix-helix domain-containing protein [Candidatus Diapherotrites archaeon]